ncbi:unnamed protein product, partial [Closterium sp. NIES-54]
PSAPPLGPLATATAAPEPCATMASLRVLAFDPEGTPVAFEMWHDNLQLYLLSDLNDSVSLFDHMSGAAPAPPATADVSTRSQWLSHDATARLAIRNHLPATKCAHFGEHKTALALYDAVVARYSSPATAAIGRLLLPYLFPELSTFATVADLPPMFITLYFIVTRLRDSLRSVRAHFLTLDPTSLTVDLLEQHLLAAETSAVAVGAARGTPRSPFFEGGGVGGGSGSGSGGSGRGGGCGGGGSGGGTGGGGGGSGGGGGGSRGSGDSGGSGTGGGRSGPWHAGPGGGRGQQQQRPSEIQTPQQLCKWLVQRGTGEGSETCPHVICTGVRAGRTCGKYHTERRWFARLDDAWPTEFGDDIERPRWAQLLQSGVPIFDLDYDVIISAMYALSFSAERDCYWCVPPDPGIAAAALGASASGTPPDTAPAEAFHTFTLDSGTSRCFFRDSTTLTPLPAPVPVRLADPSGGPDVARSSIVLPCPAVPSGSLSGLHLPSFSTNLVSTAALQDAMVTTTTPGGQCVWICTCIRTGHQLATFTRWPGSSLYTLATEPPQVAASAHVSASGQHHRLGHPSLPRLRGMHSRLLVSGLPRSLPPLPPSPASPCLPCVEGRQRDAPHSSFPPTTAPLQTLHMDIRTIGLQLREQFGQDLPILRLHFDRGVVHASGLPQQNGIAERRIGLVMEVARTSMIHAAAPRFLWPFAFYHPTSRRVLPSQDVTFDESVPFYCLFPYHAAPPLPPPLFLAPSPPPVAVVSGAAPGAASEGAEPGGAGSKGAGSGGTEPEGVEPGGAESEGAESGGAEPRGAASSGGPAGALPRLSSQQLREWRDRRQHRRSGAPGAGGDGDTGAGGAAVPTGAVRTGGDGCAGAGDPTELGATSAVGAGAKVAGVGGPGAGGAWAVGAGVGGAGDTVRPRPYFVPLLQQVLGVSSSIGLPPPFLCPPPDQSQPPLQPASPLPAPSPYTELSGGLTKRREPTSRPVSPVCNARRAPHSRPPPVPSTHTMALCPSAVPQRVPLYAPPESSLPEVPAPESNRARAASPTIARLLATAVTDPSFEFAAASALDAELLQFAAACRLDYASALVAESVPASPPSVGDPDAPDILTPCSYAEVITGPYSSQWQAAMDAEMASWKSTGTYVDEVPPLGANIVNGMWIFRLKGPPGSPPAFKARYVARGFSQRHGVDYFQTFSPTPKMTTLRVLLHVAAQRDYKLHSLDFSTAFLQGSLHEEIWLRRPPGFIGSFPAGTQWSLRRPVYGLRQAPREWHDTLRTTLAALGFAPSTADPSLFLRTDTSLPPFSVLVHSLSAPPSDESVEPSGPYLELVGCLMYLMTCTRPDLAYPLSLLARYVAPGRHQKVHWDAAKRVLRYLCSTSSMGLVLGGRGPVVLTGHADASWVDDSATQWSSQGYTFSLGSGSVSWRSTRSSSVLSSSCEAEIYAGAMAAQELRWLTYLLTHLGEQPRSPPVLYVDNKAMIALCQEHRLEHRTKHIALRYFLARELQQCGQLRLAYVATQANTADVFTKALPPGDHQRFSTVLGLMPTLPHLLIA